jgi:hypothetical protein
MPAVRCNSEICDVGMDSVGQNKMKICHACLKALEIKTPMGWQELCVFCGYDLRCCLNCTFHARGAYNDCREPQAERVVEKGRSNFCDYFVFREAASNLKEKAAKESAKTKLESLFKAD